MVEHDTTHHSKGQKNMLIRHCTASSPRGLHMGLLVGETDVAIESLHCAACKDLQPLYCLAKCGHTFCHPVSGALKIPKQCPSDMGDVYISV